MHEVGGCMQVGMTPLMMVFPLGKEYKSCVILRKGRFTSPDDIAKANIMDCVICFEEFNGELNTPMMCVTCGQTACISCFRKVRKKGPACCKYNLGSTCTTFLITAASGGCI